MPLGESKEIYFSTIRICTCINKLKNDIHMYKRLNLDQIRGRVRGEAPR